MGPSIDVEKNGKTWGIWFPVHIYIYVYLHRKQKYSTNQEIDTDWYSYTCIWCHLIATIHRPSGAFRKHRATHFRHPNFRCRIFPRTKSNHLGGYPPWRAGNPPGQYVARDGILIWTHQWEIEIIVKSHKFTELQHLEFDVGFLPVNQMWQTWLSLHVLSAVVHI